jgi:hypothetical protein
VKAEAWAQAIGDRLSLAERQAVLEGWAAPGQDRWRVGIEPGLADALRLVEASVGPESALLIARTAFPRGPEVPAVVVDGVRRLIDDGAVSDAVTRALVEQLALFERRLRARSLSAASRS